MNHSAFRTAALMGAVLLAGCAVQPSQPPQAQPTAARAYHESLTLSGRLSVLYQENDREQSLHGSFDWVQTAQDTQIMLRSPLGQALASIKVTPGSATLTEAGKPPVSATDADRLAMQTLGWPLPVAGLRDWLQGYARDNAGRQVVAMPGRDTDMQTADGWQLRYASWQYDVSPPHPKRIDLERTTSEAGRVSIRIVIDHWQAD